jgi:uncharacterized protein YndB with AHSA1/START domain
MATIYHQLLINAPAAKVYDAISTAGGIGTWWDKQTATQTDCGLVLEHNPVPEHGVVKLWVVELVPNKRVEWECISTHPKSSPASAWTGTHFIFELDEGGAGGAAGSERSPNHTTLDFRQVGYDEQSEFFGSNNFAWAQVLQSLRKAVESQRS